MLRTLIKTNPSYNNLIGISNQQSDNSALSLYVYEKGKLDFTTAFDVQAGYQMSCFNFCHSNILKNYIGCGCISSTQSKISIFQLNTNTNRFQNQSEIIDVRKINTMSFSPSEVVTPQLVCGYNKSRNTKSITLYDLPNFKIKSQYLLNETVNTVLWLNPNIILAGVINNIKQIDLREPETQSHITIPSMNITNISTNPMDNNQFLCLSNNYIKLWDIRNQSEPSYIYSLPDKCKILDDSKGIWDNRNNIYIEMIYDDLSKMKKLISIYNSQYPCENPWFKSDMKYNYVGFNLLPNSDDYKGIMLNEDKELITINIIPNNNFIITPNNTLTIFKQNENIIEIKEVIDSPIRDPKYYKRDIESCVQYFRKFEPQNELLFFWTIIQSIGNYNTSSDFFIPKEYINSGIIQIVNEETGCTLIESLFPHYFSSKRSTLLKLFHWKDYSHLFIDDDISFCRKIVYTYFSDNITFDEIMPLILSNTTEKYKSFYNSFAILLPSITSESIRLFKQIYSSILDELPYMKWIIDLLQLKTHNIKSLDLTIFNKLFDGINIPVTDKLALACLLLDTNNLKEYFQTTSSTLYENKSVMYLILNGINDDSISYLQEYLDKTDDIQTVALISCQYEYNKQLSLFIEEYEDILDSMGYWYERTAFYRDRRRTCPMKANDLVQILCFSCGAPLEISRGRVNQSVSCKTCGTILPECSICEKNLILKNNQSGDDGELWYWCQECRHGGHADHILSWFSNHNECPIGTCRCKCNLLQ